MECETCVSPGLGAICFTCVHLGKKNDLDDLCAICALGGKSVHLGAICFTCVQSDMAMMI